MKRRPDPIDLSRDRAANVSDRAPERGYEPSEWLLARSLPDDDWIIAALALSDDPQLLG